jgi:hypothetical protein
MKFNTIQEGSLIKIGIESDSGVTLFESSKHYRSLEDAMKDIVGIVEMSRKKEIEIIDRTTLEDGEKN